MVKMKINIRGVLVLVVGIMLVFVALNSVFTYTVNAFAQTRETYQEVVIQKNDTLWCIAEKITPPGQDIRNTIYQLRKINKLNSAVIQPGQRILIPR
jgi:LysM repeat protein